SQVKFSTNFDSGSIGSYNLIDSTWIYRTAEDSILTLSYEIQSRFDPLNPVDTTLKPSARWYHFCMEGVKGKQIFLNIKNSETIRPFYSYDGINYQRFEPVENIFKGSVNKIFTQDTVYIAHFIPYRYSRLLTKMEEWKSNPFVTNEIIGHSSLGLPMEMLTVTDNSINDNLKKKVWIHGRSHPSEAPASWHLEAMIDQIMADSPFARELRKNTIFYLVPIINPDGVKGGFSRSSSTGVNIEINWNRPDSLTMPEVKALKGAFEKVTRDSPVNLLLNMHSQISSSITYWIHSAESTTEEVLRKQLLLSALTINYSPYYRAQDQLFSDMAPRYPEGWVWDKFAEKTIAITFETPYTYYNQDREGPWVSIENLSELATSSLYAVSDLLDLDKSNRILIDPTEEKIPRKWLKSEVNDSIFFGKSYLIAQKEGAKLKYTVNNLPRGRYTLYKWQVGPAAKVFPTDVNVWTKEAIIIQKRDGKFNFKIKATKAGEKADALLLVKEIY
ncbi:MAG: M14 family zinc carboxypeptidase, partial [Bacteroidales bacterium]